MSQFFDQIKASDNVAECLTENAWRFENYGAKGVVMLSLAADSMSFFTLGDIKADLIEAVEEGDEEGADYCREMIQDTTNGRAVYVVEENLNIQKFFV